MVLLLYVDDCLLFIPYKDIIDKVYAYLKVDLNIEDYGELNKYLGIYMNRLSYGYIHLNQPYLTQININMIPGMDN